MLKTIKNVLVKIDGINLIINVNYFGKNSHGLYLSKCGFSSNNKVTICCGFSTNIYESIEKCISEFCERYLLLFESNKVKFQLKKIPRFLQPNEYNLNETFEVITKYPSRSEWLIPKRLFNPYADGNKIIDGTGFAAHVDFDSAIIHALSEIYERHCVGVLWDNGKCIIKKKMNINNAQITNTYFTNNLKLEIYEIILNDKIPMSCYIAITIDDENRCYFGSAASTRINSAILSAIYESLTMYINVKDTWIGDQNLHGRIKELWEVCNNKSNIQYTFLTNKASSNDQPKLIKKNKTDITAKEILDSFNTTFKGVYYKDMGKVSNRYVVKYIVPKAYIRYPFGFKSSKIKWNTKENPLTYPFG
ncbi:MAG: hypothetical protein DWQ44_09850 [Bacteroidetes bacterium]|nr:MAG: hypothetical protein DWQ33_10125 [Bacteroidota bacterium]REK06585.1 MAG: hypothetical protein DWQ39_03640 [Bacteroidota bacterium]REK33351.1 MAG: hypothetical protein DWQ44_09850 [Bacteroidota bacterium]REK49751.1 MAG: hypothetical protein DWQ48_06405 [Bacteroidota bacterium]